MAGISGAGIIVAIVMAMFGFEIKQAIAISSFATFSATLGSFFVNFKQKHPEKPKVVLVDYGVACLMMPTTLAGATIGAFVLNIMPNVYVTSFLTVFLITVMVQVVSKAI